MSSPVVAHLEKGVWRLTLSEPETRNALSLEMLEALSGHLRTVSENPNYLAVVLDAEGSSFCAGMNLKKASLEELEAATRFVDALADVYRELMFCPLPVFVAIEGAAMGGGVGLALSGDFVWAGPDARVSFPETRLGLVPALVSVVAARKVPFGMLKGLLLSGEVVEAEELTSFGMADRIVRGSASAELLAYAMDFVRTRSPEALKRTKRFVLSAEREKIERDLDRAKHEFLIAIRSKSAQKGISAFRQKKKINWTAD